MTKRFRLFVVLVFMAIGASFMWPTINWYFVLDPAVQKVASKSRESIRDYAEQQANTAFAELKGLVNTSPDGDVPAKYAFLRAKAADLYKAAHPKDIVPPFKSNRELFSAFLSPEELRAALTKKYRDDILDIKKGKKWIIQLGLDLSGGMSVVMNADRAALEKRLKETDPKKSLSDAEYSEALDQAIDQLKLIIDGFGVTEPSIRKDIGANRILIEIPGDPDPDRVKQMLMGSGNLALQIVDESVIQQMQSFQQEYAQAHDGQKWEPGQETPADLLPPGTEALPYVQKDDYGIDYTVKYIPIKQGSEYTVEGRYITDASTDRDQYGKPVTTFSLNGEGAQKFAKITKENVGKSLAIILDGKVRASATIQQEIPNGRVQLTGFTIDEGRAISKVLKAGSLKLDLKIESVQEVGASLGKDAVNSGVMAMILGFGLVFLFMLIYYLGCGIIADIALLMKLYFMFAILAVMNLTLTMTSIAGLILTVGIAVDANVIIFERIKDELRTGKGRGAAVAGGYKKAFWTIIDSNITNLIAAVLLAFFGTGPIQGFAVTLMAGIVTSLFSALFISRLIQDFETEQLGHTTMSIAWRLK